MTGPGADELRARRNLRRAVGAFDVPAAPAPPAGDWWDQLYDDTHNDHHRPDSPPPAAPRLPDWRKGETADLTKPEPDKPADDQDEPEPAEAEDWEDVPDTTPDDEPGPARRTRPAPARRVAAAYADLPSRPRWLLYNGGAAALGWSLGLEPLIEHAITSCQHDTGSTTVAVIFAAGLALAIGVLVDRRTRGWWGPLPWMCRVPLASAVLAALLYAPGATS